MMSKITLLMGLLFLACTSYAGDLGYRYVNGICQASNGAKGLNPDFLGQCGDFRAKKLHFLESDSMSVTLKSLVKPTTKPGKPPPLPRSYKVFDSSGIRLLI